MLAIICSTVIWLALVSLLCSLGQAVQEAIVHLRRLHRIPCSHCAFYTGDYRLKCTVHPCRALTEEAIHCLDYEPTDCKLADYKLADYKSADYKSADYKSADCRLVDFSG